MSRNHDGMSNLPQTLTLRDSFLFPLDTPEGRKDVLIGGLVLMLLLPIGWVLNLGARLDIVQRLYSDNRPYFRGMQPWGQTLKRGCTSATAIFFYLLPANVCFYLTYRQFAAAGWSAAVALTLLVGLCFFVLGVFTLPGCMTVFACEKDASILLNPVHAFRRAWHHRTLYFKAWGIALIAITLSFGGLFLLVVGFFFTSVWAWEVVGYAFTVAMYADE